MAPRNWNRESISSVLWVNLIVSLLVLAVAISYSVFELKASNLIYTLSAAFTLLSVWVLYSWKKVSGSIFDPYGLFIIGSVLFNGGTALLRTFFLPIDYSLFLLRHSDLMHAKALLLILIGVAFFHMGGLLSMIRKPCPPNTKKMKDSLPCEANVTRNVGFLLLFISIVPAFMELHYYTSLASYGGYSSFQMRNVAHGFAGWMRIFSHLFVPGVIFVLASSRGHRFLLAGTLILIISYSLGYFYVGSRHPAAMALIAYAWVWHKNIRRLPTAALLMCSVVLFFVIFPMISATRMTDFRSYDMFINYFRELFSVNNPIVVVLNETGQTIGTAIYTLELVPKHYGYSLGMTYIAAFLSLIPNICWDIHPALEWSPARWLASTIAPGHAALGYGFGYSFIAEAYLNFGWVGSPLIFLVFGFLIGNTAKWASRGGILDTAIIGSFLSFLLFTVRGELSEIVRPFVWYCLFPWSLAFFFAKFNLNLAIRSATSRHTHKSSNSVGNQQDAGLDYRQKPAS